MHALIGEKGEEGRAVVRGKRGHDKVDGGGGGGETILYIKGKMVVGCLEPQIGE